MTVPVLKNMLRQLPVRQRVSGNKAELVGRIADRVLYGLLPACPVCKKGFLNDPVLTSDRRAETPPT